MNAIHPAFVQALRPFAPAQQLPEVTCRQTRSGRVTEYTFSGDDLAAVRRAADVRMSQIDPYRSPAVVAQRPTADGFEVVVRYYSVD
ncbi:hypothetical protein [Cupriavidus metallidurans]|uniref:hypothetical protein n=1 Tax=Cupriavidus metallidurans TaxID=119219 RepID=UPI001644762E|nr:hypothetical protein [Cupriavidus metallidurans]